MSRTLPLRKNFNPGIRSLAGALETTFGAVFDDGTDAPSPVRAMLAVRSIQINIRSMKDNGQDRRNSN
jgi:hypothetical protein